MLHIVLYEPEIPQNTGNIMRTAVAANATLHLVGELGFLWDEKRVRRSAMDYYDHLKLKRHLDWEHFETSEKGDYYLLTRFAKKVYSDVEYKSPIEHNTYLIFGGESKGLPSLIKEKYKDRLFRIPISSQARSLNLANSVALVSFEVLRQWNFYGLDLINKIKD